MKVNDRDFFVGGQFYFKNRLDDVGVVWLRGDRWGQFGRTSREDAEHAAILAVGHKGSKGVTRLAGVGEGLGGLYAEINVRADGDVGDDFLGAVIADDFDDAHHTVVRLQEAAGERKLRSAEIFENGFAVLHNHVLVGRVKTLPVDGDGGRVAAQGHVALLHQSAAVVKHPGIAVGIYLGKAVGQVGHGAQLGKARDNGEGQHE